MRSKNSPPIRRRPKKIASSLDESTQTLKKLLVCLVANKTEKFLQDVITR